MADEADQGRSLGQARTDWAERRTALAAERTFAAWARTGLSCIGVGLAVTQLLNDLQPLWLVRVLAAGLVALGALALAFGFRSYHKSAHGLEKSGQHTLPLGWIGAFAGLLIALAIAGLILVW
ncbi:DUF202 domain-containing protein [Deinococcus frigens]|uniref:DUF202 domain-containing protein n=1 Tax=Deinococcus frigens TaxID=249403 RepID=UPI00068A7A89|nr:DUF202 domain-containing protein [Deinococcus frigens]